MAQRKIKKKPDLNREMKKTLQTPKLKTNLLLHIFFLGIDILYGFKRTLPKFRILELLARYPYQAWETLSYHRLSKNYSRRRACSWQDNAYAWHHIELGRSAQDNEQWHLLLLDDIIRQKNIKLGWIRHSLLPWFMIRIYYLMTRIIYRLRPQWSFAMNAAFEAHAEHEYMLLAREQPQWNKEKINSRYFKYYPRQRTLGDLVKRIGLDERRHKNESLDEMKKLKQNKYKRR
ncbi:MAG TPA: alternative oxidase [Spirochaetota bacterium]|nr:alternative oxidase [Spirochaetota bacterium]